MPLGGVILCIGPPIVGCPKTETSIKVHQTGDIFVIRFVTFVDMLMVFFYLTP